MTYMKPSLCCLFGLLVLTGASCSMFDRTPTAVDIRPVEIVSEYNAVDDDRFDIKINKPRTEVASIDARFDAFIQQEQDAFMKSIEGITLPEGFNYEFIVDGVTRGTLTVSQESSHTRGLLVFKSTGSNGSILLNFPIAEQSVSIRQGVTDFFTGTAPVLPGPSEGDDSIALFKSPNAPAGSQAEVSMHFGTNGPTTLEVQIGNMPAGNYTLLIGDDVRGTIQVTGTPGDTQGQLHFEVGGSGSNLPLDFPCAGQSIAITQGGTTYFFGQLPSAAP